MKDAENDLNFISKIRDTVQQQANADEYERLFNDFCNYVAVTTWMNMSSTLENPVEFRKNTIKLWMRGQREKMNFSLQNYNNALMPKDSPLRAIEVVTGKKMDDPEDIRSYKTALLKTFEEKVLCQFVQSNAKEERD